MSASAEGVDALLDARTQAVDDRDRARDLAARFAVENLVLSDALHDAITVARGQVEAAAAEALLSNAERVLDEITGGVL